MTTKEPNCTLSGNKNTDLTVNDITGSIFEEPKMQMSYIYAVITVNSRNSVSCNSGIS